MAESFKDLAGRAPFSFVFVQGPTASGKSHLAHEWAKAFGGEIVNCDSIQCYEKLNIGAAKPTPAEMAEVPHHLFSYVPLMSKQTAGDYRRAFAAWLKTQSAQTPKVYFVVGGTGFYFQALEMGMYQTPPRFPEIRKALEDEIARGRAQELYEELKGHDPKAAGKISVNDHYRLARYLEIIRGEGRPVTELREQVQSRANAFPFRLLKVATSVSRERLRSQVERRTRHMLSQGLIEEVEALVQEGYGESSALRSVGYREVLEALDGASNGALLAQEDLVVKIVQSTMRLAKKQRTWLGSHGEYLVVDPESSSERQLAEAKISDFLRA